MNKHHEFWLDRWQKSDIPFHQQEINPDLPQFWPELKLKKSSSVLVPLCGKSLDMTWLQQQGHYIVGIELSALAVEQFFESLNTPYHMEQYDGFTVFKNNHYEIWAGDILQLNAYTIRPVDAIYDRGALIALPQKIRQKYVPHVDFWLKDQGKILLKTTVYNPEEMQPPPYSVTEHEISQLYQHYSSIQKIKSITRTPENMQDHMKRGCKALTDETWIITK